MASSKSIIQPGKAPAALEYGGLKFIDKLPQGRSDETQAAILQPRAPPMSSRSQAATTTHSGSVSQSALRWAICSVPSGSRSLGAIPDSDAIQVTTGWRTVYLCLDAQLVSQVWELYTELAGGSLKVIGGATIFYKFPDSKTIFLVCYNNDGPLINSREPITTYVPSYFPYPLGQGQAFDDLVRKTLEPYIEDETDKPEDHQQATRQRYGIIPLGQGKIKGQARYWIFDNCAYHKVSEGTVRFVTAQVVSHRNASTSEVDAAAFWDDHILILKNKGNDNVSRPFLAIKLENKNDSKPPPLMLALSWLSYYDAYSKLVSQKAIPRPSRICFMIGDTIYEASYSNIIVRTVVQFDLNELGNTLADGVRGIEAEILRISKQLRGKVERWIPYTMIRLPLSRETYVLILLQNTPCLHVVQMRKPIHFAWLFRVKGKREDLQVLQDGHAQQLIRACSPSSKNRISDRAPVLRITGETTLTVERVEGPVFKCSRTAAAA